jgi:hypothetical protein
MAFPTKAVPERKRLCMLAGESGYMISGDHTPMLLFFIPMRVDKHFFDKSPPSVICIK